MITLLFQEFTIRVFNEPAYSFGSADNTHAYTKHYFSEGGVEYPVSKHGITLYDGDEEVNSCMVIATGGATGIHNHSIRLDKDRLLICCSDTLFCLSLPDLELLWNTRADAVTCFGVFQLEADYLVYGETQVCRIDRAGRIMWEFGGKDIFVTLDGPEAFKLHPGHIELTDFSKTTYKLSFGGKLLSKHNASGKNQ